jgi:hypothetical protein
MRRRHLPQLINISLRGLEIVGLESGLGLCNEIRDFLWILRSMSDRWRCRSRSVALRAEDFDAKEHDSECDGQAAADHHREPLGIEFFRGRFVVGTSSPGHCRRFGECISTRSSARRLLWRFQRWDPL